MIYFIQQGDHGPIKIGYTKNNINNRIYQIQTSCHEKLTLLGFIEGEKELEKTLQTFFHGYRLRGEWFEPSPELMDYIFSLIIGEDKAEDLERIRFLRNGNNIGINFDGLKDKNQIDIDGILEHIEIKLIIDAMDKFKGNKLEVARYLRITYRSLRHRVSKYRIYLGPDSVFVSGKANGK